MSGLTDFCSRRALLFSKMVDNSIAILWGAKTQKRNSDSEYPFRQDSDFYYLTGFNEPNAVVLFLKEAKCHRVILYCLPKNLEEECWTGYRLGPDAAKSVLGVDEAFAVSELKGKISEYLLHKTAVYSLWGDMQQERQLNGWITELRHNARKESACPTQAFDLRSLIHEARLFKDAGEIAQMQRAVDVSILGHQRAMRRSKEGLFEYHLQAELLHAFLEEGLLDCAYYPIVGSGANGCILHYNANRDPLKSGDLVLIDAAAEFQCYAADITRTFPVNGQFTAEQKDLYDLVLEAQLAGIAAIKPGNRWDEIQKAILNTMVPGLIDLGILQGRVDDIIEQEAYRKVYMHGSGHWLGLDVHDAGAYKVDKQWRPLEPNMVLTVEPGIYIRPDQSIPLKWHNLGIRVEDDVLVTSVGASVLSQQLVKRSEEIEAFMA